MRRVRIAIVGFGRLGRACAQTAHDSSALALAGIVRRAGGAPLPLEAPLASVPVATHIRDLPVVDAALVCVPAAATLEIAAELLQQGIAVVECAAFEERALEAHHAELARLSVRHRARAVVGAGWDPGVLTVLRRAFEMLVPHGATELTRRPAVRLHHTAAAALPGVRAALASEVRAGAERQRYVYVELAPGARLDAVQAAIAADPAYVGEETHVFAVDDVAALEAEGQGVLLERRGGSGPAAHQTLLLEGRFDPTVFAARAMLDAARRVPQLAIGGHPYHLSMRP